MPAAHPSERPMTSLFLAVAFICAGGTAPAARMTMGQPAAWNPVMGMRSYRLRLPGSIDMNKARSKSRPRLAAMDRAEFLESNEESAEEVYHENKKNPWHSMALAMLPGLFYKPLAIGLSWKYCGPNEKKSYRNIAFINAVPASGFGSFYSEWGYWAGAIAMVGDAVGSSLVTMYFYEEHHKSEGRDRKLLFAGLAVVGFFWVFDVIMGPVGALQYNKELRNKFLSQAPSKRYFETPPSPPAGLAEIGPNPTGPAPFVLGYAGTF